MFNQMHLKLAKKKIPENYQVPSKNISEKRNLVSKFGSLYCLRKISPVAQVIPTLFEWQRKLKYTSSYFW